MTPVRVEGRAIVVLRAADGRLHALRDVCPHQGAPLSAGVFGGTTVPSDVPVYRFGKENEVVRCPWHGFEFDVVTGEQLYDPHSSLRVKTYAVEAEDGFVVVELK
jgi:nitrite reductase (NADH) small subunit